MKTTKYEVLAIAFGIGFINCLILAIGGMSVLEMMHFMISNIFGEANAPSMMTLGLAQSALSLLCVPFFVALLIVLFRFMKVLKG